jgi:hypothetical protein
MADYPMDPEEVLTTQSPELSFETVSVPGKNRQYNIETVLGIEDAIDDGELVAAEVLSERSTLGEFISEYEDDSKTLKIFLGYAENSWSSEEMWQETDHRRDEIFGATEVLEEDYGVIETDFGDVELTERGNEVHRAFQELTQKQ